MPKTKTKTKRVFGYTDIHWSDRDESAVAVAMKAQKLFKPDLTVIGGDLLNANAFSRHPKMKIDEDTKYDYVEGELDPASAFLDECQDNTTGGHLAVIEGNHDAWFERWISGLPGGQGRALKAMRPEVYLMKDRKNAQWIPYSDTVGDRRGYLFLHPKLIVVHGWCATRYSADRHLQLAKPYSIIYHHSHRAESRMVTMADGKVVGAWNAGCLCKPQPTYALSGNPSEWTQGFWVAYIGESSFTVYTIPILSGKAVLPDGTEVKT